VGPAVSVEGQGNVIFGIAALRHPFDLPRLAIPAGVMDQTIFLVADMGPAGGVQDKGGVVVAHMLGRGAVHRL